MNEQLKQAEFDYFTALINRINSCREEDSWRDRDEVLEEQPPGGGSRTRTTDCGGGYLKVSRNVGQHPQPPR